MRNQLPEATIVDFSNRQDCTLPFSRGNLPLQETEVCPFDLHPVHVWVVCFAWSSFPSVVLILLPLLVLSLSTQNDWLLKSWKGKTSVGSTITSGSSLVLVPIYPRTCLLSKVSWTDQLLWYWHPMLSSCRTTLPIVFSTTCTCEFGAIFYAVTTIIIHCTGVPNFIACIPKNFVCCSLPGPLRLLVPTFFSIVFQMLLVHASEFLFVVSAKICGSSTNFSFRSRLTRSWQRLSRYCLNYGFASTESPQSCPTDLVAPHRKYFWVSSEECPSLMLL